jgi:hypothetical protein
VVVGLVAVVVVGAGATAVVVAEPFSTPKPSSAAQAASTATTAVAQRDLSSQTNVDGTLGYSGAFTIVNQGQGVLTALPAVGQVVSEGEVLYRISDKPVVLLYGSTPAYRALSSGATGADVEELNAALVALGYATSAQLSPTSDTFGSATVTALEKLQKKLGVDQTGTLALGEAVFLPSAIRVATVPATLGGQAGGPVLTATSTNRVINVALSAARQSQIKVGDAVVITLPDNSTTPGVVQSIGTVATAAQQGQAPTIPVVVTPTDPGATGAVDQAPVQISIVTATAKDALVVPVNALVALADGGYAVEVVSPDGTRRLEAVTLGLFDDAAGVVQITGTGVAAGQRVVVPST